MESPGRVNAKSAQIQCRNNSGAEADPFLVNFPVMPFTKPGRYRTEIFWRMNE